MAGPFLRSALRTIYDLARHPRGNGVALLFARRSPEILSLHALLSRCAVGRDEPRERAAESAAHRGAGLFPARPARPHHPASVDRRILPLPRCAAREAVDLV